MKKIVKELKTFIEDRKEFGTAISILKIMCRIFSYEKYPCSLFYFILQKKHKLIINRLSDINVDNTKILVKEEMAIARDVKINDTIWVFWWQGEENAPVLVKTCLESIRKFAGKHEVVLIAQDNLKKYVSLPEVIMHKYVNGKIEITHLSDILRMYLLYTYGGLWLDATILVTDKIADQYFVMEYFTGKLNRERYSCISEKRWNGSFLASRAGGLLPKSMYAAFLSYWSRHNHMIDYFLIDYLITIFIARDSRIAEVYKKIPVNNESIFQLAPLLNKECNLDILNEILSNSHFHKLNWRIELIEDKRKETYFEIIRRKIIYEN